MSVWDDITKPVNDVLDSTAFKAVMPVQALGQEAVKAASGAAGINGGQGIDPATQYAIGAGTGATLAGGSALMGSSPAASPASSTASASPAASPWESHASPLRYARAFQSLGGSGYQQPQQQQQSSLPMPPYPTIRRS